MVIFQAKNQLLKKSANKKFLDFNAIRATSWDLLAGQNELFKCLIPQMVLDLCQKQNPKKSTFRSIITFFAEI